MKRGVNSTTMEDLDDNMLTQILVRLPNCKTVLACSPVNKRWCSLIFDLNFPVLFDNHKKKTNSDHEDDGPPWTLITAVHVREQPLIKEFISRSPKLSLGCLPCKSFTATATFKDLVLCYSYEKGGRVYYITNPLTKQWVALPPCPVTKQLITRIALICQRPYNLTQHYKFRVVKLLVQGRVHSLDTIKLVVYCSEIGKWKEINIRIPKEAGPFRIMTSAEPEIVVCNDLLYFKGGLCLVALDPFDVNDACGTTLDARVMPPLPVFGYLHESSGQLLVVHTPKTHGATCLWYKNAGSSIELPMMMWRLDLNKAPLGRWEMAFQGLCKGTLNSVELACNTVSDNNIYPRHIVVPPYNHKLIYMYLASEEEFVSCDMQTRCITPSKSLPNYCLSKFLRLEHQWWPTAIPACAMHHNRTGVATTTDYSYYITTDFY
ncbi:uncharacterized protein LOC141627784 [Silene latifolia]|uniref:uncharacterized protein LOC141627784 n=1 Tax=Silene latifolia TaxID=37657 RepID=UPI003D77859B